MSGPLAGSALECEQALRLGAKESSPDRISCALGIATADERTTREQSASRIAPSLLPPMQTVRARLWNNIRNCAPGPRAIRRAKRGSGFRAVPAIGAAFPAYGSGRPAWGDAGNLSSATGSSPRQCSFTVVLEAMRFALKHEAVAEHEIRERTH